MLIRSQVGGRIHKETKMGTKVDASIDESVENPVEAVTEQGEIDPMTQEQLMVNNIIQVVWSALAQANEKGMPLSRDGACIAFTEVLLRLTIAHAKQTEGGAERFKDMFDL